MPMKNLGTSYKVSQYPYQSLQSNIFSHFILITTFLFLCKFYQKKKKKEKFPAF